MKGAAPQLAAWLALVALLAGAACLAAFTPPAVHVPIVLVNAVVMVGLIVTGYMGFFRLSHLVRVFALGGLLWVAFMVTLTFADFLSR